MEINTKLSIGDEMFYMRDNKVQSVTLTDMSINIDGALVEGDKPEITIEITYQTFGGGWLREEEVFATKEELLKSL